MSPPRVTNVDSMSLRMLSSLVAGPVAEVHHAVAEAALVEQLKVDPDASGQRALAAAHHHGRDEQVALVHQPGLDRLAGQPGAAHADIPARARFQLPDGLRLELPLDPSPGGG